MLHFCLSTVSLTLSREHQILLSILYWRRFGAQVWGAGGTQRREVGSVLGLCLVEPKQAPSSPRLSHMPAGGMAVAGILSCGWAPEGGREGVGKDQRVSHAPPCMCSPEPFCILDTCGGAGAPGRQFPTLTPAWRPDKSLLKVCRPRSAEHRVGVVHRKPSKFKVGWVLALLSPCTYLRHSKWQ